MFLQKEQDGQLDVAAMRPPQVRAYLTQTALNKAMDEGKRAARRRSVSLDDDDLGIEPADPGRELDEQLASRFDDARVREIVSAACRTEQLVIKLRFLFSSTRLTGDPTLYGDQRARYRRELGARSPTARRSASSWYARRHHSARATAASFLAYVTGVAGPNRRLEAPGGLEAARPAPAGFWNCGHNASRRGDHAGPAAGPAAASLGCQPRPDCLVAHGARQRFAGLVASARDHGLQALARTDPVPDLGSEQRTTDGRGDDGHRLPGRRIHRHICVVHGLPAPIDSLVDLPLHAGRRDDRHHSDPKEIDRAARDTRRQPRFEPRALRAGERRPARHAPAGGSPQTETGSVVGRQRACTVRGPQLTRRPAARPHDDHRCKPRGWRQEQPPQSSAWAAAP